MVMSTKQKRRWQSRVDEAAQPMIENLQHLDMDPELLDHLSHVVAADVLWHLDQMKKPGIMHQALTRRKQ